MIDAMAQAWLQLQYWTEKAVERSRVEPREEAYEYARWKHQQRIEREAHHEPPGRWEIATVSEQEALESATQTADRWQRMFFRAVRQLRDWRRYAPQVTINNPQQVNIGEQVNIAADGGRQINVSDK